MSASTSKGVEVRTVTLRLDAGLLEAVDRRAAKRGVSREQWLRHTLSVWTRVKSRRHGRLSHAVAARVLAELK